MVRWRDWILRNVRNSRHYARTGNPWSGWNESGISWTWSCDVRTGCPARQRPWAPCTRSLGFPGPFSWPTSISRCCSPGARSWSPMSPRLSESHRLITFPCSIVIRSIHVLSFDVASVFKNVIFISSVFRLWVKMFEQDLLSDGDQLIVD